MIVVQIKCASDMGPHYGQLSWATFSKLHCIYVMNDLDWMNLVFEVNVFNYNVSDIVSSKPDIAFSLSQSNQK